MASMGDSPMDEKVRDDQNAQVLQRPEGDGGGFELKEERRRPGDEGEKENEPNRAEEIKVPSAESMQNGGGQVVPEVKLVVPIVEWYRYLWLDVLDTLGHWLEGQVLGIDHSAMAVRIHYKGYPPKWDEWVSMKNERLAPLHSHTVRPMLHQLRMPPFHEGLQLNVYDSIDKWGLAEVIAMDPAHRIIQVHYVEWSALYDEWINMDSYRLAPLNSMVIPKQRKQPSKPSALAVNEQKYARDLNNDGRLFLVDMAADGNCLFRSVSHQVYGSPDYHFTVRRKCMEYMEAQEEYFRVFVDDEDFKSYIARMKYEGQWGGEPEIRAMGEIYQRPVEIYVYSVVPRICYPGPQPKAYPIRLSYHWNSHYMSLIDPYKHRQGVGFLRSEPGQYEDQMIRGSRRLAEGDSAEMEILRAALQASRKQMDLDFNKAVSQLVNDSDLEDIKRESADTDLERAVIEQAKKESLDVNTELEIVKKLSADEFEKKQLMDIGLVNASSDPKDMPGPMRNLLSMGFDPVQVEMAYAMLHDPNTTEDIDTTNMVLYLEALRNS